MQERLVRLGEVMRRTGLSRSAIYDGIKNEEFPRPRKIGKRSVAWVESEIDVWVQARVQDK